MLIEFGTRFLFVKINRTIKKEKFVVDLPASVEVFVTEYKKIVV